MEPLSDGVFAPLPPHLWCVSVYQAICNSGHQRSQILFNYLANLRKVLVYLATYMCCLYIRYRNFKVLTQLSHLKNRSSNKIEIAYNLETSGISETWITASAMVANT